MNSVGLKRLESGTLVKDYEGPDKELENKLCRCVYQRLLLKVLGS